MNENLRATGLWTALLFLILAAVYSSTIVYPYVLTDEAWIIRPGTASWTYSMGRPFFSGLGWLASQMWGARGLDVIYAMRLSAIAGLAGTAFVVMRWLQMWGHDRLTASFIAIALMTLPAYQIVVADGTQLAIAIFFAVLATHLYFRYANRSMIPISAGLLFAALLIYQQQVLVAYAMLAVPLLRRREIDRRVLEYGALATTVSIGYFVAWKMLYRLIWPARVDTRYGPDAVSIPGVDQLAHFLDTRLPQIASFWDVSQPNYGIIAVTALSLMAVKAASDIIESREAVVRYGLLLGLLAASDGFAILARAYPSYVTGTAISLVLLYWAYCGAAVVLRTFAPHSAGMLAAAGCVAAFFTVKDEIAVPNWRHMQEIRAAILDNPTAQDFYVLGTPTGGSGYQEFGWRNSATDVYLHLASIDVADDLALKGLVSPSRRSTLYFGIGGIATWASPDSTPKERRANAVLVNLQR